MNDAQFERLMAEIQGIKEKMENLATREEVMKVSDTLQSITTETAAAVEHKAEANDVLLKSLLDGLENRLTAKINQLDGKLDQVGSKIDKLEEKIDTNTQAVLEAVKPLGELVNLLVDRAHRQDATLEVFGKRLLEQRRITSQIQQKVQELEGR